MRNDDTDERRRARVQHRREALDALSDALDAHDPEALLAAAPQLHAEHEEIARELGLDEFADAGRERRERAEARLREHEQGEDAG